MRSAEAAALALLLAACNLPATLTKEEALTCDADQFRLEGSIDGHDISVMQPSEGGGFMQSGGGEFASLSRAAQMGAPSLADVRLIWADVVVSGDSSPATGTFSLPGTAVAGVTFCANRGTAVRPVPSAEGGGLQFRLAGLSTGVKCDTLHEGSVLGCWRPPALTP